jgi:hypothetical protein
MPGSLSDWKTIVRVVLFFAALNWTQSLITEVVPSVRT